MIYNIFNCIIPPSVDCTIFSSFCWCFIIWHNYWRKRLTSVRLLQPVKQGLIKSNCTLTVYKKCCVCTKPLMKSHEARAEQTSEIKIISLWNCFDFLWHLRAVWLLARFCLGFFDYLCASLDNSGRLRATVFPERRIPSLSVPVIACSPGYEFQSTNFSWWNHSYSCSRYVRVSRVTNSFLITVTRNNPLCPKNDRDGPLPLNDEVDHSPHFDVPVGTPQHLSLFDYLEQYPVYLEDGHFCEMQAAGNELHVHNRLEKRFDRAVAGWVKGKNHWSS